jgi:hypothetical protein
MYYPDYFLYFTFENNTPGFGLPHHFREQVIFNQHACVNRAIRQQKLIFKTKQRIHFSLKIRLKNPEGSGFFTGFDALRPMESALLMLVTFISFSRSKTICPL